MLESFRLPFNFDPVPLQAELPLAMPDGARERDGSRPRTLPLTEHAGTT